MSNVVARAQEDDEEASSAGLMEDIGLGDLQDVMDKASGGSDTPDWIPAELQEPLTFLGSDNVDIGQKVLVEKYGETLYRELGFSKLSETINGRLAMIGVVYGIGGIFSGDVLTQFANAPLPATIIALAIVTGTVIPVVKPEGYIPEGIKKTIDGALEGAGLGDIFTEKAELINGRAAMVGFAGLLVLSILF